MSNRKYLWLLLLPLTYLSPLPTYCLVSLINWGLDNHYTIELEIDQAKWSGSKIDFIHPKVTIKESLYQHIGEQQPIFFKVLLYLFDFRFVNGEILIDQTSLPFNAYVSNEHSELYLNGCKLFLDHSITGEFDHFPLSFTRIFLPEEILEIKGELCGKLSPNNLLTIEDFALVTPHGTPINLPNITLQIAGDRLLFQSTSYQLEGELDFNMGQLKTHADVFGKDIKTAGGLTGDLLIDEIPFTYRYHEAKILLEGNVEGIALSFDVSISDGIVIDLHQLAGPAEALLKKVPLPHVPLKGLVLCRNQQIRYEQGFIGQLGFELLEGEITLPGGYIAKELQADLLVDLPSGKLEIEQLHGRIEGREKSYSILSNALLFDPDRQFGLRFDLWLSDDEQDLVRLAGRAYGDTIEMERSHICQIKPDLFQIKVKGLDIEEVHFKAKAPIGSLNKRLCRLIDDLSATKYGSLLSPICALNTIEGFITLELDQTGENINVSLNGQSIIKKNGERLPLHLLARKIDSHWFIDDFCLDHIKLSGELIRNGDVWHIPYMGIDYGGVIACGIKGDFYEEEERLLFTAPIISIDLTSLPAHFGEELFPQPFVGTLFGKGAGSYSPKGLTASFWGDLRGFEGGILSSDGGKVELYLHPYSFELLVDHMTIPFGIPIDDIRIASDRTTIRATANCIDRFVATSNTMHQWHLKTSEGSYDIATGQNYYAIESIRGEGNKTYIDLKKVDDRLTGQVSLNLKEAYPLLDRSLLPRLNLPIEGGIVELTGDWSTKGFAGKMALNGLTLPGGNIAHIDSLIEMDQERLHLHGFSLVDPKIHLNIEDLLVKNGNDGLYIEAADLKGTHFNPTQILELLSKSSTFHSLTIKELNLDSFSLASNEIKGKGQIQFSRLFPFNQSLKISSSQAELANHLTVDPKWLLPSNGEVEFIVEQDKIVITKFKDFYSEGKGIRFELFGEDREAHILFDGTVNIPLKLKPHNIPIKWVEMVMLTLKGSLIAPSLQLTSKR